eukprot:1189878-Prorocentrum_minimum.AAC.5
MLTVATAEESETIRERRTLSMCVGWLCDANVGAVTCTLAAGCAASELFTWVAIVVASFVPFTFPMFHLITMYSRIVRMSACGALKRDPR